MKSNILKLSLFATGFSGIVAEYILSTLATYFLGDSVLQWTLIVSVMLFAMGLGSRLSKYLEKNLLQKFIYLEFALSLLVSLSSLVAYSAAAFTIYTIFIIYTLSIIIGLLIGLEIPLVVRLNEEFEELRINVASVIEKDYYGSLAGGLFFAFVGLPYLGLTYTPFVLGSLNFAVSLFLISILWKYQIKRFKIKLLFFGVCVALAITFGAVTSKRIILYGEQHKYKDKIIYEEQSKYQRIIITQWKNDYWLYLNGNQQFCTLDEIMYHDPLVHPIVKLSKTPYNVLILGGGDGCAARELLKYDDIKTITLIDIDPSMTRLGKEHDIISTINRNSMNNSKVTVINADGFAYLEQCSDFFDIVIVDLPDPKTVELSRLYSYEFYKMCYKHLRPQGFMITQAGSPYYATKAFLCIENSMKAANFSTLKFHNQIITLGEWGWVLGSKHLSSEALLEQFNNCDFGNETIWLNKKAAIMMTSFGKVIYPNIGVSDSVEINTVHNPVLYKYYMNGNWSLY